MKLLFDENLSDRILPEILDLYPESSHIKLHDLIGADDTVIWDFSQRYDFTLVSKDSDFHQRSLLYGAPPKFIYLRIGNGPTSRVVEILRTEFSLISQFDTDPNAAILILT